MTPEAKLFQMLIILFIVVAGYLLWIKVRDWLHKPKPEPRPEDAPNQDHRFSLRRLK